MLKKPVPEPSPVSEPYLIRCNPLSATERPLLNKFYKAHGSAMRASDAGECWVARSEGIIAGLNLTVVPGGYWLTGLLVAPDWRQRGVARVLVDTACRDRRTWLFCHPDLQGFYERLGFVASEDLPQALVDRLARYRRSKPLVAMGRDQSSAAGSSPGNSTSV